MFWLNQYFTQIWRNFCTLASVNIIYNQKNYNLWWRKYYNVCLGKQQQKLLMSFKRLQKYSDFTNRFWIWLISTWSNSLFDLPKLFIPVYYHFPFCNKKCFVNFHLYKKKKKMKKVQKFSLPIWCLLFLLKLKNILETMRL